jgi:hypothetical protein
LEDVIRIDLREIGLGGVVSIWLAQDRDRWHTVVSAVMNFRVLAPRSWLVIWSWLTNRQVFGRRLYFESFHYFSNFPPTRLEYSVIRLWSFHQSMEHPVKRLQHDQTITSN